ncbi:hypothetical protein lerEdw1_001212 [Lerista edwardsae]|nr:hypothetical protein lerEdw1_001214 [Lerista edwardsae]KAJ6650989.1 hypothetical protein lerEdw1_001212 [Lerista edwardsae]
MGLVLVDAFRLLNGVNESRLGFFVDLALISQVEPVGSCNFTIVGIPYGYYQWLESHPGISIMKTDYLPSSFPHGDEFLPVLSKGSERGSGFSRQKETQATTEPQPGPLSHAQFQGLQQPPQTLTHMLGRESVGKKELSGFSANNLSYVTPAYDPDHPNRFLTSYNSKFYENIPKGVDREGWTRGGIQPQLGSGFSINNHATDLGTDPNATEILRNIHPHVGRTMTTVDPFYRDSPHDRRFTALHQTTVPN